MKTTARRIRRGFTLVELSIAVMLGLAIGAMVISLFNQQVAFLKIYQKQTFLTEEAPMISQHVRQLVGKADRFRLHDTVADALAGTNPRLTASPVLLCGSHDRCSGFSAVGDLQTAEGCPVLHGSGSAPDDDHRTE
jgi:Tfp pilus assembly protein PilE